MLKQGQSPGGEGENPQGNKPHGFYTCLHFMYQYFSITRSTGKEFDTES